MMFHIQVNFVEFSPLSGTRYIAIVCVMFMFGNLMGSIIYILDPGSLPPNTEVTCYNKKWEPKCKNKQVLNILSANWGRLDETTDQCPSLNKQVHQSCDL